MLGSADGRARRAPDVHDWPQAAAGRAAVEGRPTAAPHCAHLQALDRGGYGPAAGPHQTSRLAVHRVRHSPVRRPLPGALSGPRSPHPRSRLRSFFWGPPWVRVRHAGPAIAGARRQTWRCASARTRAFELQRGCAAWLPSALRPGTPLRRRWPVSMQARPARSEYPAPRLKPRDISTAVSHVAQILSGRCVRSKIGAPPTPNPSLLRGPAVFECFRRRARSRWATPRYPVRRSRSDTSSSLVRADGVLLERAAGPLSRCPSTLVMIPAAINTYSSSCARLPVALWPPECVVRSAGAPRARYARMFGSSNGMGASGTRTQVYLRVCQ